jgi:hypothetical protein
MHRTPRGEIRSKVRPSSRGGNKSDCRLGQHRTFGLALGARKSQPAKEFFVGGVQGEAVARPTGEGKIALRLLRHLPEVPLVWMLFAEPHAETCDETAFYLCQIAGFRR